MSAAVAGGTLAALAPTLLIGGAVDETASAAGATTALRLAGEGRSVPALYRDGPRIIGGVVPVEAAGEPEPAQATATGLIKAAGLDDVARQAEEAASCEVSLPQLGKVKPWARAAAEFISCLFDDPDVLGVGGRGRASDHPNGLAVDFMSRSAKGDRIARCVLDNQDELGVSYVIWKQRINYGDGWEPMEDRGSVTENHFDHVHVSFDRTAPADGIPDPTRCT